MVKLVDTLVLGTSAFGRGGSTPSRGTDLKNNFFIIKEFVDSKVFKGLKEGKNMKSIELGTFALIVLFIGGMTIKHNDQVRADQQASDTLEQVRMKQDRDNKSRAMATTATIRHDGKSSTNTVFVSLDASSSFDGGNVADQIYFTRFVPDKNKPICAKYEENCTPRMGRGCECIEIQLDECGEEMYEPLCAEYEKDCSPVKGYNNIYRGNMGNIYSSANNDGCRCIDYLEVEVEYLDDCEYQVIDHSNRESYLKRAMSRVTPVPNQKKQYEPDTGLSYSWEQISGPSSEIQKYSKKSSMVLELEEGEYTFRCTVSDKYGAKDMATHRVIVTKEPNNPPEANIMGSVLLGKPSKK